MVSWLVVLHVLVLQLSVSNALDNGLARTPPMGWMYAALDHPTPPSSI
jgi:hypothetical protein|eukprot:COSAG02_NODE_1214_length_13857_cov_17.738334_9_plen_48_part_00